MVNVQEPKQGNEVEQGQDHKSVFWRTYGNAILSGTLLIMGLIFQHLLQAEFFKAWLVPLWYAVAYVPVGLPVIRDAIKSLGRGSIFNEFFLMSIATIGAFAIGEYPEGVAVMLFYAVGELFQHNAVHRAKDNIQKLLDVRPQKATLWQTGKWINVHPESVEVGQRIQVKVGEKIPLDGKLLSDKSTVNTAALTGESRPRTVRQNELLLAGFINLDRVIEIEVTQLFENSSIARILELVQNASSRKAKTELLIRRLAKVYTPIVVYLALAIWLLPYFFVDDYILADWLYRALIFLVISCPCALVISIPLGYFGGLGAASKNGLLFKGATFLDQLTQVDTIVFDKTGTLTEGKFEVSDRFSTGEYKIEDWWPLLLAVEAQSNHPIAKAIRAYPYQGQISSAASVKEMAGKGLQGVIGTKEVLAGNQALMQDFRIAVPKIVNEIVETMVLLAVDNKFVGYVIIADQLKSDAVDTMQRLRTLGVRKLHLLSGDNSAIVQKVGYELGLDTAKGDLLPEDKLQAFEKIKQSSLGKTIYVGDGINDAPVLAASDIGIAMGGLGSDVAIETADVIIQTDQLSKLVTGIKISKSTKQIIWQNIGFAFGIKAVVLILGALGMASMWAAVFADVGVALLAILNAVRLQSMEWQ
jgi:Cd2+/Zn2+-exporting ATPase